MKKLLTPLLLILLAAPFLTACGDDDYYDEMTLSNREWRVVEVTGPSPYDRGDYFYFYRNGDFEIVGTGGLHEYGQWRVRNHTLQMLFDGSGYNVDIEAPIPVLDGGYAVLDCYDYYYNTRYTLRIVAERELGYRY